MPNNDKETTPKGVGLYKSEWDQLEKIARKNDATLHSMAVYGLRYFIKEYQRGNVRIKKEPKIAKP